MFVVRRSTYYALMTMIFFVLLSFTQLHAAEETIPIQRDPFIFYTAVEEPSWSIIRARLQEAFRRIGLTMELVKPESAQRSMFLANEQGDGDANRVYNIKELAPQNTSNLVQIPEVTHTDVLAVYSIDLDFPVEGWQSIKDYRNGARIGAKIIEKKLPGQRSFVASTEQLVKMLIAGRLDTFVDFEQISDKAIKDLGMTGKVKRLSPVLLTTPMYSYIHKKYQDLVPKIADALRQMKEDGTFDRIQEEILNPGPEQPDLVFYTGMDSPYKAILQGRLQEAFHRIGKQFTLVFPGSSQRALTMANEEGDGDAARVVNIKEIAPENTGNLVQIPEVTSWTAFHVYSRDRDFQVDGWTSLAGTRNGFRVGLKLLEKNVPGTRTILPSTERLLQMLDAGRLDTVIEHSSVADCLLAEKKHTTIHKLSPPLQEIPVYSYIHKKHQSLIPQIVKALVEMKADGTFANIEEDILKETPQQ